MSEFTLIASKVAGVLMVMAIGALARWLGWLSSASDKSLAVLTANILLPALFLDRIVAESPLADAIANASLVKSDSASAVAPLESGATTSSKTQSVSASESAVFKTLIPPLIGFSCTCIGLTLAWIAVKSIGPLVGLVDDKVQKTFVLAVGICNYGYIPLPLAQQFFPAAEVPLLIHNVGVDVAMWSLGILVISGDIKSGWKRVVFSPPLWAMAFSVFVKQSGLHVYIPSPLMQAARSLGYCAIPVGLLLSGAIIVDNWREVKWRTSLPTLALASSLRMLILPLIFLSIAGMPWLPSHMNEVLLLQAAMPAATFPIVLARLYNGDLPTALRVIVGTSLMGLVTIPLWIVIGKYWLGIE